MNNTRLRVNLFSHVKTARKRGDKALKLKASYTIAIPVQFAGKRLFFMRIPLTVTRSLTLKE